MNRLSGTFREPGVGGSRSESAYPGLESEAFTAHGDLGRSATDSMRPMVRMQL